MKPVLVLGLTLPLWLGLVPAFAQSSPDTTLLSQQQPPATTTDTAPAAATQADPAAAAQVDPATATQAAPAAITPADPATQADPAAATQLAPAAATQADPVTAPQADTAVVQPAVSTAQAQPAAVVQGSLYRSQWAQDSVRVLQENGIQIPQGINYTALINLDAFSLLLGQVTSVPETQLKSLSLPVPEANPAGITRGQAIHLVLASFGLTESLPGFANQASKFSDLPPAHPAYASIVLAESVHLINGYPDHTIRPNEQLSWGEALILVETVYSWRKALPTTAPEWVRNYQKRQNMWYQLIDGFRLLLTLAYVALAMYFFGRTWFKLRRQKQSPYRSYSLGLGLVTLMLGSLWISELLFNYSLIPREVYATLAMLSVLAGLFLLKLGSDIDGDLSKPKPQVVIDAGYVTSINHEKGELFIRDKISDSHSLALAGSETKILRKTGKKSVESAFLSDIEIGDVVSLRASRLEHDSLIQIERLTLIEKAQQQVENTQQQAIREYVQTP
ncbi:MAG TPA: S-layer homology domain-containing protein, partial [Candidatus Obscuribacterales bacterium]